MSEKMQQRSETSVTDCERAGVARSLRRLPSTELLGCQRELIIEHAGREYRLRLTSNGKLILTA